MGSFRRHGSREEQNKTLLLANGFDQGISEHQRGMFYQRRRAAFGGSRPISMQIYISSSAAL
jgi:hypothetical protein